ncbi:hypothetical protein LCGC14_2034960 [marine sediment metagenome]|uniref:Uncharacterized protein n=1 Tax=marine sediment metagenome TaxID=412755 RepID=A0A0F9FG57_9ZZZZ
MPHRWGDSNTDLEVIINNEPWLIFDFDIKDIQNQQINEASFVVYADETDKPSEFQEVIINHRESTGINKIYAGRIAQIIPAKLNNSVFSYEIICSDFTMDLNEDLVTEAFVSTSLNTIVNFLITNYTTGITTVNVVSPGPTIEAISFNYLTVGDCLMKIKEMTGFDWYVDYDKDLHVFNISDAGAAPISLLDNKFDYDELVVNVDMFISELKRLNNALLVITSKAFIKLNVKNIRI